MFNDNDGGFLEDVREVNVFGFKTDHEEEDGTRNILDDDFMSYLKADSKPNENQFSFDNSDEMAKVKVNYTHINTILKK